MRQSRHLILRSDGVKAAQARIHVSKHIYVACVPYPFSVNLAVDQFASRSTVHTLAQFVFYVNYGLW